MKTKKIIALVMALAFALTILPGCQTKAETSTEETPAVVEETPATRIVQDSDGNDVEIPYVVERVVPIIGAFAQMTEMLTDGSGKIVAAATQNISDKFKEVFPDYVASNPNNYDSSSIEDIIAAGAQVVYGPSSVFTEEQQAQLAEAGIAFVGINNIQNVDGMCQSFEIIGSILGEAEAAKAAEFVEYYRGNIALAQELTKDVAGTVTLASLFYTADGYTTINGKDICNEYIEAAGAVNVAKDYVPEGQGNTLTVDSEQLVEWNPSAIITNSQTGKEAILSDPAFANVAAVKAGNVFVSPYGIYLWSVRSGEGAMMPLWIGSQIYPEQFADVDMNQVVKDFFSEYYNYELTDEETADVLDGDAGTQMTR